MLDSRRSGLSMAGRWRMATHAAVLGGLLAVGGTAQAAISFSFDYGSDPIFNDPASGAARKAAVESAASAFSAMFGTFFGTTGNVVLSVSGSNDQSNTLASAGSQLVAGNAPGFTGIDVVRTKLLTGVDANGASADGSVNVNFGQNWQLNGSAPVASNQVDFYSTMFHELTHALGFSSAIGQDGSSVYNTATMWGAFDRYITDVNRTPLISASTFTLNTALWATASVGGPSPAGGLFFNGPSAVAANAGKPVGIFSPNPWQEGSSGSHIDDSNPAYAGLMMLAATGSGPSARTYSAIEVGILRDLGYVAVVPEPGTYALMLAGLGLMLRVGRRRQG